ncbi:p24 family protein gamma-3 [Mytilus galloprovincialis]|uniref:p24 family protein gamma-3 n=1 Tax=Mytilus galloprovincialis TaxID=29158 RepID=A0A8B6GI07_MYTGA|nr:p24 family protein gamma-3 [Mytilus galloprovincialis]
MKTLIVFCFIFGCNVQISQTFYSGGVALTFELGDQEKSCFIETFPGGKSYVFSYQVIRGGNNDVDAWVVSPNGKILYKEQRKEHDEFRFDPSKGDFQFCFGNEFSTITHKVVYFTISAEEIDSLAVEAGDKKPTAQTMIQDACDEIHSAMTDVFDNQVDFRLKESMGRYVAEELNNRIMWWSIGQALTVMIIGFGQVFILKTFFTDKLPSHSKLQET